MIDILGAGGLTNTGRAGGVTSADCGGCDCPGECELFADTTLTIPPLLNLDGTLTLTSPSTPNTPEGEYFGQYRLPYSNSCCRLEIVEITQFSYPTNSPFNYAGIRECGQVGNTFTNFTPPSSTPPILPDLDGSCINAFYVRSSVPYEIKVRLTDCEDDGEWCYTFDADGLEDWSKIDYTGWTPPYIGNYSPGVGWVNSQMVLPGGGSGDCRTDGIAIRKTFTPRIVTEIDTLYDWTNGTFAGSCGAARRVSILGFRNGVLQFDTGLEGSITNGTNKTTNWQGSAELDEIIVRGDPSYYRPSGGGSDGVFVLKEVLVRGEGTNPFGDDTCS